MRTDSQKIEEFLAFLESVEEVNPELIDSVQEATIAILEGKGDAIKGISSAVKKVAKYFKKSADDIPGKKAIDDAPVKGIKKSADDIASPKKGKKGKKTKKIAKAGAFSGLGAALASDDDNTNSDNNNNNTVAARDSSGRFWPNNFITGTLTNAQQELIDTSALFGDNEIPGEVIVKLNSISPLDEDELDDATARYVEVYEYWTHVYKSGMTSAYDDQMDKGTPVKEDTTEEPSSNDESSLVDEIKDII